MGLPYLKFQIATVELQAKKEIHTTIHQSYGWPFSLYFQKVLKNYIIS